MDIIYELAAATADEIISLCASMHITLSLCGADCFTAGPSSRLTLAIRAGLAAHKPAILARLLRAAGASSTRAGTAPCDECGEPGTDMMVDGACLCMTHKEEYWARVFPIAPPEVQAATLAAVRAAHATTAGGEGRLFG